MGTFKSFEDIEAWQEGRKLVRSVRAVCKRPTVARDYAFVDQITRSARSICVHIAEGNDSITTPDFIKFLSYAKPSAVEVRAHLYDALDENYISQSEFEELSELSKTVSRMLANLIRYLQGVDQKRMRIKAHI